MSVLAAASTATTEVAFHGNLVSDVTIQHCNGSVFIGFVFSGCSDVIEDSRVDAFRRLAPLCGERIACHAVAGRRREVRGIGFGFSEVALATRLPIDESCFPFLARARLSPMAVLWLLCRDWHWRESKASAENL